jgi:hypothetical protein
VISVPAGRGLAALAWAAAIGYLLWFCEVMQSGSYDQWVAWVVVPAVAVPTVVLALRQAKEENDFSIAVVILVALIVKLLVGSLARHVVAFDVYEGQADAFAYDHHGRLVAESFRHGDFTVDVGRPIVRTGFIRLLTGYVYTAIGPSTIGGFLMYSWFGFLGLFFCYKAFRLAVPDGAHRRYARLVFFLPSLVFWPSSIGKEAWAVMGLGIGLYGAARICRRLRFGLVVTAAGVFALGIVRPHVGVVLLSAVGVGWCLSLARGRQGGPAPQLFGVALLVAAVLLLGAPTERLIAGQFGAETADQVLDIAEEQTEQGGASFDAPRVHTIVDMPGAMVSLLFRPFPYETVNELGFLAALEGLALLLAFALSWRRVVTFALRAIRQPYVALCFAYMVMFTVAFSTFGNFGILARQRVQVLPLMLVVLAMPASPGARQTGPDAALPDTDGRGARAAGRSDWRRRPRDHEQRRPSVPIAS